MAHRAGTDAGARCTSQRALHPHHASETGGGMMAEPFISARAAARFCGYEPGDGLARTDKEMRAFWEWCRRMRIPKYGRGRYRVFRVSELEAAILGKADRDASTASLDRMAQLAREHVQLRAVKAR